MSGVVRQGMYDDNTADVPTSNLTVLTSCSRIFIPLGRAQYKLLDAPVPI